MSKITKNVGNKNSQSYDKSTELLFSLSDFNHKAVEVRFNTEQISSDGGLLLLNKVDNQLQLIDKLTNCINNTRNQGYVKHNVNSMLRHPKKQSKPYSERKLIALNPGIENNFQRNRLIHNMIFTA
ncbi:MAG: transposase [Lentimicrobiaceae bacterium]|jgi:hypothetical protein